MKTVILFSSQTSGTGSLWRIAEALNDGRRKTTMQYILKIRKNAHVIAPELTVPPKKDHLILFNHPPTANRNIELDDYNFIVNFRDPRDRLCNGFFWQLGHPTSETDQVRSKRRKHVKSIGIDQWVLETSVKPAFSNYNDNIFWLLETAPSEIIKLTSYAKLCFDVPGVIDLMGQFLGSAKSEESLEKLGKEMPDQLQSNPNWIGNRWGKEHSDLKPGRYRHELKSDTIEQLSAHFRSDLERMAFYDPDYAEFYLQDLK